MIYLHPFSPSRLDPCVDLHITNTAGDISYPTSALTNFDRARNRVKRKRLAKCRCGTALQKVKRASETYCQGYVVMFD